MMPTPRRNFLQIHVRNHEAVDGGQIGGLGISASNRRIFQGGGQNVFNPRFDRLGGGFFRFRLFRRLGARLVGGFQRLPFNVIVLGLLR
jgi:hypothetical protein